MHVSNFCKFFGSSWHLPGKGQFSSVHNKPLSPRQQQVKNWIPSSQFPNVKCLGTVYFIFAIKQRKWDIGYPKSVVNAAKHPKKWRRTTEPYLSSHSTHKTTESKVSIFENFKITKPIKYFHYHRLWHSNVLVRSKLARKLAFPGLYGRRALGTSYFEWESVTGTRNKRSRNRRKVISTDRVHAKGALMQYSRGLEELKVIRSIWQDALVSKVSKR